MRDIYQILDIDCQNFVYQRDKFANEKDFNNAYKCDVLFDVINIHRKTVKQKLQQAGIEVE